MTDWDLHNGDTIGTGWDLHNGDVIGTPHSCGMTIERDTGLMCNKRPAVKLNLPYGNHTLYLCKRHWHGMQTRPGGTSWRVVENLDGDEE